MVTILGIVDHKSKINNSNKNDHTLITCAWRSVNGVLLGNSSEKCLAETESINSPILLLHIIGKPTTGITIDYSTIKGNIDSENHYIKLSNRIKVIPWRYLLIVLEDFNAHLSNDQYQYSYHSHKNINGQLIDNLMLEHHLLLS